VETATTWELERTEEMKAFYGALFGWSFQDWGADYTAFSESGVDGGFNAGDEQRTKASLQAVRCTPAYCWP
jgi:predicted enzyme related to lactoylglutathione lyase